MSTVTGTARSWEPATARTSPEIPEPPMPPTTTLVMAGPDRAPRSADAAAASASVNCSGREATAPAKSRESTPAVTA